MLNIIGFGIFWFFLFIVQWCNLITITQTIADRYCYLPMIGLMLALSAILSDFSCLLMVYYGTVTHLTIPMYKDFRNFLEHHTHYAKHNPLAYYFLAQNYIANKDYMRALITAQEGLIYNPQDFKLLCILGSAYVFIGNKPYAMASFNLAKQNLIPSKKQEQIDLVNNLIKRAGLK